jgi:hypothetical protein
MVERLGRDPIAAQCRKQPAMLPDIRTIGREVQCPIHLLRGTLERAVAKVCKPELVQCVCV